MDKNIKAVFDDLCGNLVIDGNLVRRVATYVHKLTTRNEDHVEFFGGNLIGPNIVRFTDADRNNWFVDILEADERDLEDRIHSLPSINKDFKVSSDVMNLSALWLVYAFNRSNKLSASAREQGKHWVMMALNIKLLTSAMFRYFQYPSDMELAKAVYAEMNGKYLIKQHGTWYGVMEYRSAEILAPNSIHAKVLKNFDNDKDIVYAINDIQGRPREMVKQIFFELHIPLKEQGKRVLTNKAMIETDGEEALKDKTNSLDNYVRYLHSIMPDKDSLIKEDLVQVIERIMKTMPESLFRETLEWMTENTVSKHGKFILDNSQELLVHAFDYLKGNRTLLRNTADLPNLLGKLKGTYMASRNSDKVLLELRDNYEKMVVLATKNKNKTIIPSVRTGVMLYLVVRTLTMKHYTNN